MKKKYTIAVIGIVVFLAVFIPLASTNPDGLERVIISLGGQEGESFWKGIIPDYSVSGVGNSYLSTLVAGIIGVVLVLVVGLLITKGLKPKTEKTNSKRITG
jgi:cobalt/nickel transport system permease protein